MRKIQGEERHTPRINQLVPLSRIFNLVKFISPDWLSRTLTIGLLVVPLAITFIIAITATRDGSIKQAGNTKLGVFTPRAITSTASSVKATKSSSAASKAAIAAPKKSSVQSDTPVSSYRFGIAYGDTLAFETTSQLDATFADAKSLGVNWIRFDMAWDDIQPTASTDYNWSATDNIVNQANKYGLNSLPILDYTPSWARPADCTTSDKCAPANDSQFATYATAAVKRYTPMGVHTWEIWNEPNIYTFWQPTPSPSAYTKLLQSVYPAIKSANPAATVLSGGLGPLDEYSASINQLSFLSDMYADGAKAYFDAVSYHPYSFPAPPSYVASWSGWSVMDDTPTSMRSIMVAHGDADKQIWITEFGAPTGGPGAEATSLNWSSHLSADHVDNALQAEMVTQGVAYYKSHPWLGSFFWYSYQDLGTSQKTAENFYGLLNYNGSQKPSYGAYKSAIATKDP